MSQPQVMCHKDFLYLADENAQKIHRQAPELVVLDELVQVDAQQLEHEAEVVTKQEKVPHPDDVMPVLWIPPGVQKLQDAHLDTSLHRRTASRLAIRVTNQQWQAGPLDNGCRRKQAKDDHQTDGGVSRPSMPY